MQPMDTITRRQMSWILGGLGAAQVHGQTKKSGTTIHQENDFKAPPARIYEALLDAKLFTAFSGAPAEIDRRVGGAFKLFGGAIEGRNVELVANQRIVQAWRPADWTAGVYSVAKFELVAREGGTRIVFDHTGFADGLADHLASGWDEHYWEPLRKYFK
jgi:activator of HSP90 ATPase